MFSKEIYRSRRKALAASLKGKGGIILFLGNSEAPLDYPDNCYRFHQDSSFNYFWGLCEPDLAAVIDLDNGDEMLFGNDVDIEDIVWTGPMPVLKEKAEKVGVEKTAALCAVEKVVSEAVRGGRVVRFLPPYRNQTKIFLHKLLGIGFDEMGLRSDPELTKAVIELRIVKQDCEIAEIDAACNIGYQMHMSALKAMKPGILEQELVGLMEGIAISKGSMISFPIILSQNGETLHNHHHHQILTPGRLCVIDAGAISNTGYCSDFTRTLPPSGKFTPLQAEVYTIVSDANNKALATARPGISYQQVHLAATGVIVEGLKAMGLMKGNVDDALQAGAVGLFMPHGLGHNMGMDVHDMEDLGEDLVGYGDGTVRSTIPCLRSLRMGRTLKAGHVISDEPGIYFIPALIEKWESEGLCKDFINYDALKAFYTFGGIRLEDDLLITPDGCRLLGDKRLPITVPDVEAAMA